jgi:hypothetical protein
MGSHFTSGTSHRNPWPAKRFSQRVTASAAPLGQAVVAPALLKTSSPLPYNMKQLITSLLLCFCVMASAESIAAPSHATLSKLLGKYVNRSGVDYAGLKQESTTLISYLEEMANVSDSEFKRLSKDQQMAFLINLYNASTLKLVVDHYPVKSIKDIGASSGGPWKQPVVRLFGKATTLDSIENELLRPIYKDPRIHFAINCASIGCPSLRSEAFQAEKLASQLDEQTRLFLKDLSKNRIEPKNKALYLSSIFDWFKDDFIGKSGSIEKFITPFLDPTDRQALEKGGFAIKYNEYSWSLNKQ